MLDFLQRLLVGHVHNWEIIDEIEGHYQGDFWGGPYTRYTLRCTVCGRIKKKMIK